MGIHTYTFDQAPYSTHTHLLSKIPTGSTVLDVGSAGGYLGEYLVKEKECTLIGIDPDVTAAKEARGRGYAQVFEQGVEEVLASGAITQDIDIVLCADVLEHLINPWATLTTLVSYLPVGGKVVISLPNVSYYKIRLMLLFGKWNYADAGIMDRTHTFFFTHKTLRGMVEQAGLEIQEHIPVDGSLERFGINKLFGIGQKLLYALPTVFATQWIIVGEKK